ncbi:unnamed protein product [Rhizophagus irregularis]|nr:unnamed protein product [Rhizophagus irregularis]
MNQSADYTHISSFIETIERTPSNVPFYASLVIRRRNNRRERHRISRIRIDTIRVWDYQHKIQTIHTYAMLKYASNKLIYGQYYLSQ